jgi:hypothetical protein
VEPYDDMEFFFKGWHFNDSTISGFVGMHASVVLGLLFTKILCTYRASGWHEEAMLAIGSGYHSDLRQ